MNVGFKHGLDDHAAGKGEEDNPYAPGTHGHEAWREGHELATRVAEQAAQPVKD